MIGLAANSSQAQYILGSFQGRSDPTDVGWYNSVTGNPITNDPAMSFPAAGVPGYPLSLQMTGAFGSVALELNFSSAQIAAFNTNTILSFTFSVPAWTNSGYSQIYNLALNAPGLGYTNVGSGGNAAATWGAYSTATGDTANNQNGMPNFYFYNGSPLQTQTVSFNYSSFLPAIEAGGESYLQMVFQDNPGGGAPDYIYMNNVVLSVPEPATGVLALVGGVMALWAMRRRKYNG